MFSAVIRIPRIRRTCREVCRIIICVCATIRGSQDRICITRRGSRRASKATCGVAVSNDVDDVRVVGTDPRERGRVSDERYFPGSCCHRNRAGRHRVLVGVLHYFRPNLPEPDSIDRVTAQRK